MTEKITNNPNNKVDDLSLDKLIEAIDDLIKKVDAKSKSDIKQASDDGASGSGGRSEAVSVDQESPAVVPCGGDAAVELPGMCGTLRRMVPCGGERGARSSREKAESLGETGKSTVRGGGGGADFEEPGFCGTLRRMGPCGGDSAARNSRGKAEFPADSAKSTIGSGGGGVGGAVAVEESGLCGTLQRMVPCGSDGGDGNKTEKAEITGESAKSTVGSGGEAVAAKEPGLCGKLWRMVPCGDGGTGSSKGNAESPGESVKSRSGDRRRIEMDKLQSSLEQMKTGLIELVNFMSEFRSGFKERKEDIEQLLKILSSALEKPSDDAVERRLRDINRDVRRLKHRIPSSSKAPSIGAHPDDRAKAAPESSGAKTVEQLLDLQASESFEKSSFYNDVKLNIYGGLSPNEQKCLLCFSLFAENELVKKRMLTYWWDGEGYLAEAIGSSDGAIKTAKEAVEGILGRLVETGFIEPVYKKQWPEAKRHRMTAVHRSAVVQLAEEAKFFVFDEHGNLAAKYHDGSSKKIGADAKDTADKAAGGSERVKKWIDEDKLETIFNANEKFPDLRLSKLAKDQKDLTAVEWLEKMKNLRVLYLGSWRASGKHHIEVDSTEFLEGLKKMSSLRLFSLQGISRISELTKSIKGLVNLEILDLKSCHNLEEIPDEIRFLRNLTHLDVSNCYLIDHMPKGLSYLKKLQVLKGFVVGDYRNQTRKFCSLEDLKLMQKLRKLSIIISNKEFPTEDDLASLSKLQELQNLALSWGAISSDQHSGIFNRAPRTPKISMDNAKKNGQEKSKNDLPSEQLPKSLEKLDLQCYPEPTIPPWLSPRNLEKLKKLYIRGGNFKENLKILETWRSVQTLRLKYLKAMKMSWEELQEFFPNLTYLEKVDCPMITLCPCDEDGVWMKEGNKPEF